MRVSTPISQEQLDIIERLLNKARKASTFKRVQCVWLRARFSMDSKTIAQITNFKPGTVRKIWSNYLREGEKSLNCKDRGGRRKSNLTLDEERHFLAFFLDKAGPEDILRVAEVQSAYEKHMGRRVPKSTIYRLLARHGWKKPTLEAPVANSSDIPESSDFADSDQARYTDAGVDI